MPLSPEDEKFRLLRESLAPEAEPAQIIPVDEEEVDPSVPEPQVDVAPAPKVTVPPATSGTPLPAPRDSYGPGADRAALEAAIQDRRGSDSAASFLDAASLFNKASGGHAGDLAAPARAHRDDSFNDVMRRRALSDQDAAATKRQHDSDMDTASRDPGSDISVRARALFRGTQVGKALSDRMGDRFEALSASQLPGARDIISSETDLLKTSLKAGGHGSDGSAEALEALAQRADEAMPGLGDKVRSYGPTAKGLATARDVVHQIVGQKFQNEQQEKVRTASYGKTSDEQSAAQDTKKLKRLQDLGNAIKPEFSTGVSALNKLETIIAEEEGKHGKDNIPGIGPGGAILSQVPLAKTLLQSDRAKEIQGLGKLLEVFGRKDITGSAFSEVERREINGLLNNIWSGADFKASLGRVKLIVNGALNRLYAAHPDVRREFMQGNPDLQTDIYKVDSAPSGNEASPHMPTLDPGAAAARGINPAGINGATQLDLSTQVTEPARGPPPQKPGKATMEMPDGSFIYVPPERVEEARARLKASPVKYGGK